jgi:hypothetical protein
LAKAGARSVGRDVQAIRRSLKPRPRGAARCADHRPRRSDQLLAEYGELVRKLVARLARKRPSLLARGDLRIWAAAVIYAVGSLNFLFDRTQRPHMTADQLSALTGVPKGTLASKAKLIRDVLRIRQMEPG